MTSNRRKAEAFRDALMRQAEAAWRRALLSKTEIERAEAHDEAHACLILASQQAEFIIASADVRPVKFTRRNAGPQSKTFMRAAFVREIAKLNSGLKRQSLARTVWDHPDAAQHFKTYEAVYRFLGRADFL